MSDDRIHKAVSDDGTEIIGRVRGKGPSLVFVHGGLSNGNQGWVHVLPFLEHSFTCYLMSTRGRGLSAEPVGGDYSLERLVQDVVAFAISAGEPVGLVGHSLGGALALGAAADSTAISAVAVYEPAVFEVTSDVDPSSGDKATRVAEAVAEGRLADAARAMIEGAATDEEMAALGARGVFEEWALNVRVALQEAQQARESGSRSPTDPSALSRITAPCLYLHGSRTPTTWYTRAADYAADHVADFRVREIDGAGHLAPQIKPETLSVELRQFLETAMMTED